jgi:hypothetical protein
MKRICVFCGSSVGVKPEYAAAAVQFGSAMAARGVGLVYGGASVGVMGAVADAVLARGGEVIGVIPKALLKKEVAHEGVTAMHVTDTMHQRKALMSELSDAFVTLPGGIGTFDELFETWTWAQLGYHGKPFGMLNVAGYYDMLLTFLDHVVEQGFLRPEYRRMIRMETDSERLLDELAAYRPPEVVKWVDRQDL